jgi:hypothetical protein
MGDAHRRRTGRGPWIATEEDDRQMRGELESIAASSAPEGRLPRSISVSSASGSNSVNSWVAVAASAAAAVSNP